MKVIDKQCGEVIFKDEAVSEWMDGEGILVAYDEPLKRAYLLRSVSDPAGLKYYMLQEMTYVLKSADGGAVRPTVNRLLAYVDGEGWQLYYFKTLAAFGSWLAKSVN